MPLDAQNCHGVAILFVWSWGYDHVLCDQEVCVTFVLLLCNYAVLHHDAFQELMEIPFHLPQLKLYCLSFEEGGLSAWNFSFLLSFFSEIRFHCIKKNNLLKEFMKRDETGERILQGTVLIPIQTYNEKCLQYL